MAAPIFQFHEGSINTFTLKKFQVILKLFQFHEGSINTVDAAIMQLVNLDFNSMKVRLILSLNFGIRMRRQFQFHEGSINTSK